MNNNDRITQTINRAHEMFTAIQGGHEECRFDAVMQQLEGVFSDTDQLPDDFCDALLVKIMDDIGACLGTAYLELRAKVRMQEELQERRN